MSTMTKVPPAAPVAPWMGGKKALHRAIIEQINGIQHDTYVEPFVGMGGVFLRRTWQPKCEVVNDLNGEIINLFRILQRHYPQFIDVMKYQITSRGDFDRLRSCDPASLTDLERAARFLYLQRLSFGGQVNGVFGVAKGRPARFNLSNLEPILDAAHSRLNGVVFENLPWRDIVERYDGPGTLFYLDPPYLGGESDYGKGMFDRRQFAEMADVLGAIEGAFIMSINDCAETRDLFGGFDFKAVSLNYTISKDQSTDAAELIVTNRAGRQDLFAQVSESG